MIDCYCDYEPARFYVARRLTARKEHQCYECGRDINAGEQYERVAGMWDDYDGIMVYKTCSHCLDIRQFVKNSVPCFCWAHGSMLDDAGETIREAIWRAPLETKGLFMGYGRLVIAKNRAK
jgi:hypothetical protein